jgi:hypothetical protein
MTRPVNSRVSAVQTPDVVTDPVTTSVTKASSIADPEPVKAGGVRLRGLNVLLDSDVGQAFVVDCCRHTEGLLSDTDIKSKWALSDEDWMRLATNAPLLEAVRAERDRRIIAGDAAKEGAQKHFAKAPNVLGDILTDQQVSPRHRIEAARELRQVAGEKLGGASGADEKIIIKINLGGDQKLIFEKQIAPCEPVPSDDGELL